MKEKIQNASKTYATVLKENKIKFEHVPALIIKTNQNSSVNVLQKDQKELISNIFLPLNNLKKLKNGTVKVNLKQKQDISNVTKTLKDALGTECSIDVESLKQPKTMIIGVVNQCSVEEMENDLNKRNFKSVKSKCKVIHIYKSGSKQTVIIGTPTEIYKTIRKNKNKIYVGHHRCHVIDDIDLKICTHCLRFNHNKNKCTKTTTCLNCAGNHNIAECSVVDIFKCTSCVYSNEKYGTAHNTQHCVTDTEKCLILRCKIKKNIQLIDYPFTPFIPSFLFKTKVVNKSAEPSS